jgi:hypothetical protein
MTSSSDVEDTNHPRILSITVEKNQTYEVAKITIPESTQTVTCDHFLRYAQEIKEISKTCKVNRFLIDVGQLSFSGDIFDQYKLAYRVFRDLEFRLDWKLALLIPPENQSYDFLETVMINAGYRVRKFIAMPVAINWLVL